MDSNIKKVSVIVPVFNEDKTIEKLVLEILKARVCGLQKEVIVVNDGSTDLTREVLSRLKKRYKDLKVFHKENGGKGSAIRYGLKRSTGQVIIPQDADLELSPKSYEKLIMPIISGKFFVVFGDRKWMRAKIPFHSKMANFIVTGLANVLYGANIRDEACGYKVSTSTIYKALNLKSNRFEICPEFLAKVRKLGYKIKNIPVRFTPRKFSEGKKINFKDGLKAIWLLIKFRFVV